MFLSRPDIIKRINDGSVRLKPMVGADAIKQVSIDLRLGHNFTVFCAPSHISAIRVAPATLFGADLWRTEHRDSYFLKPGEFVLAQTLEHLTLPHDLAGLVEGRSSWARIGISAHVTAPKLDPGFSGTITLEMTNHLNTTVELVAEESPCQLMLVPISTPLDANDVYGASQDDIFQGQTKPLPDKK